MTSLSPAARANLRHCFIDAGFTSAAADAMVDDAAPSDVSLSDMRLIVNELAYLPPLCPQQHVEVLRHQLLRVAPSRGMGSIPASDASGAVTSPSAQAVRRIVNDNSSDLEVARRALKLLTAITRQPEGSAAPGDADGPPARVTLRELKAGTPSTLGEPLHVDGKPAVRREESLPVSLRHACTFVRGASHSAFRTNPRGRQAALGAPSTGAELVRRPRLIWTFDAANPLRICSWRARACIETEAVCVGGGLVVSERLRCDPPFLHEGMTTDLRGKRIGARLQLVTDPDWFNVEGACRLMEAAGAAV